MVGHADGLVADAAKWRSVVKGRAPANHRVFEELERLLGEAEGAATRERIERAWHGRSFDVFYDRPLLFVAALRFEALRSGPSHPLFSALGAEVPEPETVTRAGLLRALESESVWDSLASRFVQTNETSRAVTWLWPAALAGCDRGARPLALVEIGTAAGLNLVGDRLPAVWRNQQGTPLEVVNAPRTVARVGIDRRPLDVRDEEAVTWMRACIWAGERKRLERFAAAVEAFRADPPELCVADAVDAPTVLGRVSDRVPPGGLCIAFQTIVRDYFDPATNRAYESAMRGWLAAQPRARALWLELEIDHRELDEARPAVILAHAPDGNGGVVDFSLARTSYHPADLSIDPDAARELGVLAAPAR